MKRTNQVVRKFNIADADMISEARNKHSFFVQDKAAFVAFDADFEDPFAPDYLTQIVTAEDNLNDEQVLGEMAQLTAAVNAAMENCRTHFQKMKYFIDKAFPKDLGKQIEFGYRQYGEVRNDQNGMIQFMRNLNEAVTKYTAELTAAKCPAEMLTETTAFRDALITADVAQDSFKNLRPTLTQERIVQLNGVWDNLVKICDAGKIIFAGDYARLQLYNIPQPAASQPTPPEPEPTP